MQNLPKGYYAVVSVEENAPLPEVFSYKGVNYAVTPDQNVFRDVHAAAEAACLVPDVVLEGLAYSAFTTPVLLFSAGSHTFTKFVFSKSLSLLGQNAEVNPNLPADGGAMPAQNPAFLENASLLQGSYWYGRTWVKDPAVQEVLFDGFVKQDVRFIDTRTEGTFTTTFKNIQHTGPYATHLYHCYEGGCNLHRQMYMQNIRVAGIDGLDYGHNFLLVHTQSLEIRGLCFASTDLLFGFTNISKSLTTGNAKILLQDCYFADCKGENGISNTCTDQNARFDLTLQNCTFKNASREGEAPLQMHLPNNDCRLTVQNCAFTDTRGNEAAVTVRGNAQNANLLNCTFNGFAQPVATVPALPLSAPEYINNTPGRTDCADPHQVVAGDFAKLDQVYSGRKAYYGDLHVHTDCGGTSDGHYPMSDWVAELDRLDVDFAAVVDHRQMRGFFLPEWDEERFIIGTEPATRIKDMECPYGKESIYTSIHYNMLFPHKYGLAMVLANFPTFEFKGDELTGSFSYARFTKAEMEELFNYVKSIGGIMVHPHPKTMMSSYNPLDYYFGEGMFLETLYEAYDSNASFRNYNLWVELLAMGKKVYTSAGSDTHQAPQNACVSTFYTRERSGRAFFDQMKTGDFAVGAFGMQMAIDDTPMGGETAFKEGQTLHLRVADGFAHALKDNTAYELRVYTDQGLAYKSTFNGKCPQALALQVQNRKFYRAEVYDLTHNYRIAIGNPIWLA